jgi:hypothetical protein
MGFITAGTQRRRQRGAEHRQCTRQSSFAARTSRRRPLKYVVTPSCVSEPDPPPSTCGTTTRGRRSAGTAIPLPLSDQAENRSRQDQERRSGASAWHDVREPCEHGQCGLPLTYADFLASEVRHPAATRLPNEAPFLARAGARHRSSHRSTRSSGKSAHVAPAGAYVPSFQRF